MKLFQVIFPAAAFFLQLVSVIASDDALTFNEEEFDPENVDAVLESEHFIQVVDRRTNIPPHNIAVKTVHRNSSPAVYAQDTFQGSRAPFQTSIPNSRPPSYGDVFNRQPQNGDLNLESGGNNTSQTRQSSMIDGWTPLPKWEDLAQEYGNEDNSFGMENEFLPLTMDNSERGLSRSRRQASLTDGSGSTVDDSEFVITGPGSVTKEKVNKPLKDKLKKKFPASDIDTEVTQIDTVQTRRKKRQANISLKVYAKIKYDTDTLSGMEIATALYELTLPNEGLLINNVNYQVSSAFLKDDESDKGLLPVICFFCKTYQTCISSPLDNTTWTCSLSDKKFYEFGKDVGDIPFPPDVEQATVTLRSPYPFPFEQNLVHNIMVSANGLVSVSEKFTSFSPVPCYILNSRRGGRVLAVYWTDLDVVQNDIGQVWSRVIINSGTVDKHAKSLLERANSDVMQYTSERSFNTIVLVVVTWSELAPYPVMSSTNERVTFQLVIMSNLVSTYAMYIYAQGALKLDPTENRLVEVCWKERSLDLFRNNYYSFDRIIGNTNSNGKWIYKVGHVLDSRAKCNNWYQSNLQMYSLILFWNSIVEQCPCTQFEAWFSFLWIPSERQLGCYDSFPIYGRFGRRCCYAGNIFSSAFDNRIPNAGSFQTYTPYFGDRNSHEQFDSAPKRWCCTESSLCNHYYTVRPISFCRPRFTWRSFFFGDPHISTLDKFYYTFNGLGEFTLLEIKGALALNNTPVDFKLQGRTCLAKTENGTLSSATVFCALALQTTNGTKVNVEIHKDGMYMVIYAIQDFTALFRDNHNFTATSGGIYLKRINESLKLSTSDDIGVTISLQKQYNLLDFTVEINSKYKNMTKGLMGNFNGDSSDDLIFENGTTLPNTSSERQIFEFGNSWRVKVNQSILKYGLGESYSTFYNTSFIPIFIEDFNATDVADAEKFCGGKENVACVYDLLATNNKDLAAGTKDAGSTYEQEENILSNQAPIIDGPDSFNVTVNETTMILLSGSDADNDSFNFVVIEQPSSGFNYSIENGTFIAYYTPTDLSLASIEVAANDSKGLQSNAININLIICSGCSKRGKCNFDDAEPVNQSDYFSIASCECHPAYSGVNCENDTDGCYEDMCPTGTNCTDIPAEEEMRTNNSYKCSDCPKGFQLNASKCEDINECNVSAHVCDSTSDCINTQGSYKCKCKPGYRRSKSGKCADINECNENQNLCNQNCINIIGSYMCSCYPGFKIDMNHHICNKTNVDPCENLTHTNCEYGCKNSSGVAECFCESGEQLNSDGHSCDDIDECTQNLCAQNCNNTFGSYSCSCLPGYMLSDDFLSCAICPAGTYGNKCGNTCDCRGNAVDCDHVKGCICDKGWTGQNCDEDVDECKAIISPCSQEMNCVNTNGSYECVCPTGYSNIYGNGSCVNINECEDQSLNLCQYGCVDNPGSYTCVCPEGYNSVDNNCEDIDECMLSISKCNDNCQNVDGSYNCDCKPGYILDFDRKSCIIDVNFIPPQCVNASCEHICMAEGGSPSCSCHMGYGLAADQKTCIDIDECATNTHNCSDNCLNTNGSYDCSCKDGRQLRNDRRTCIACHGYNWGPDCRNECACSPIGASQCDPAQGCVCNPGWMGTSCYINMNECNQNQKICPDYSTCVDTPGSYYCQCNQGFQWDSLNNMCSDIDECNGQPCDQACNNTIGSYFCSCTKGFYVDGNKCKDIDECAKSELNNCDQNCRNTIGGFACECFDGYLLNTTSRNTCYNPSPSTCNCSDICTVNNGTEVCFCQPGYQLASDNKTCEDINECAGSNLCTNGTCHNTNGSFNCDCASGLKLAGDGVTCEACDHGFYGLNCSSLCTCNTTTTTKCLADSGTCECRPGWNGTTCSDDINECINPSPCGVNSRCHNLPGSYKCVCDIGYFPTVNGSCTSCDANHYGQDCLSKCNCTKANTQSCDRNNGTCTCKPGWNGTSCETPIVCDPWFYGLNCSSPCTCNTTTTMKCLADKGTCECRPGWNGATCSDDINECINPNQCGANSICNNSPASYECVCDMGYFPTGNGSCTPCDANHYGQNCSSNCSCVMANTQICDRNNGTCTCKPGWNGTTCETSIECDATHYGQDCLSNCSCEVGNTQSCDRYTGACTCKPSWSGTSCNAQALTNERDLTIGLAVGIPLFVILIAVVALLAICYVRRKRQRDQETSSQSVDHAAPFRTQFPTRVSTKGSWGAPLGMYAPDAYSEIGSMDSSNGGLIKARQKGRPDFQDSPWYDNRVIGASAVPENTEESTAPTSNFSWEYMFRLLEPHRDFEIQRPNVEILPNPAFTAASSDPNSTA